MKSEKQLTLLVAEDDDSNFFLVEILLKKKYRIVRACDGVEAVELFKLESPDIVLMDIKMPRMDGFMATRRIRSMNTRVPIIAVTAYAFDRDRRVAYDCGCNAYIVKPINFKQLLDTISCLLPSPN